MESVLSDFIHELVVANEIPVHSISVPCDDWEWFDLGLRSKVLGDDSLKNLNKWCRDHAGPILHYWTDPFQCNYVSMNLPESEKWLFLGPLLFEDIKGPRFDRLFESLGLPEKLRVPLQNHYYNIKRIPYYAVFESFVNTVADHIYGKGQYQIVYYHTDEIEEWGKKYFYSETAAQIPQDPFLNVRYIEERYEAENAAIRAVSAGNEAQGLAAFSKMQLAMLPQRVSSELRDMKNYTITLNTLLRKAVEEAGVHPYHIDRRSNSNVQQIEQLTNVEQCKVFQRKLLRGYCEMVRQYNLKDYSMTIRKTITYISIDLTADLSLKSIAGQLNVNPSYLSALFKKETGMTLTEYVNKHRIEQAQKLLAGTDLPVKNISLQCGISDMYYFSRMFKRITGLTPRGYREKARRA